MLERLWADWRSAYVRGLDDPEVEPDPPANAPQGHGSLFERILASGLSDEDALVVHRGELASVLLNAYPYGSGHLLIVSNRAVERVSDLTDAEAAELWGLVDQAVRVVDDEYGAPGANVGLNQGSAAGAGVPDHLHVHVLPRWHSDTNFMTSIAETRVLPESLGDTWRRVSVAWARVSNRLTS